MLDWLDLWSFALGLIVGGALTAAGFAVHLRINVQRSGDTHKSVQKKIHAGGDVVGRDKVERPDE